MMLIQLLERDFDVYDKIFLTLYPDMALMTYSIEQVQLLHKDEVPVG